MAVGLVFGAISHHNFLFEKRLTVGSQNLLLLPIDPFTLRIQKVFRFFSELRGLYLDL